MRPLFLTVVIGISAIVTFSHSGPLNGSTAALVLAVLFQVYLPGYLLARMMGKLRLGQPVLRFAWILLCGLSLSIVLAGFARVLNITVPVYLLILHLLMLLLAWLAHPAPPQIPWRWTWRKLPLYILLALCCLTVMGVSYTNRYRFYGFEDQVIFIGNATWLAHNPGEEPLGYPLRTRQEGLLATMTDSRHDTDGWTYTHAAWVWSSGVPASQLIWFDLNPLFLWTVPLVIFGLAYTLVRREEAAAWSAAGLVIAGLLTLDNIVHNPTYTAYGRFAVFQINTLRQMSITIMLPLALMAAFTYLRSFRWRDLALLVLAGLALALLHPIQIMLFTLALGVTAALKWLAKPNGRRLRRLLPLIPAVLLLLALPYIQRLNRVGLGSADTVVEAEAEPDTGEAAPAVSTAGGFLILSDFPLLGDTFIRSPQRVFYHPVILLAVLLGLLYVLRLRKSLAAQYLFGTTALLLLLSFTPGLTEFYNKLVSSVGLLATLFILPVALILGLSLDHLLRFAAGRRYPLWPLSVGAVILGVLLLFEPVPIPASARDQINDYNTMQETRRWQPVHTAVAESLKRNIPPEPLSIIMAPPDTVNIAIEDLPHTLIVGGRSTGRTAADRLASRFYDQTNVEAPWLDSQDLDLLAATGVTQLLLRSTHSRLAQVLLDPADFTLLDRPAGHDLFARSPDAVPDAVDALYARMNALYAQIAEPRWGPEGFALVRPGDPLGWGPIVADWQAMLNQDPQNDRLRLGLAFSQMMSGADDAGAAAVGGLTAALPADSAAAGCTGLYAGQPGPCRRGCCRAAGCAGRAVAGDARAGRPDAADGGFLPSDVR